LDFRIRAPSRLADYDRRDITGHNRVRQFHCFLEVFVFMFRCQRFLTISLTALALGSLCPLTPAQSAPPNETNVNCTFTQGYWKNHSGSWPVASIFLGTVSYTKAQVLQIFGQPVAGNGLIKLAHQLSAAKLNIALGASPAAVAQTIIDADNMIGSRVVPPIGTGTLGNSAVDALNDALTLFNEGVTGPGHCGALPVETTTWGGLKARHTN
jgi:hypothetical protein